MKLLLIFLIIFLCAFVIFIFPHILDYYNENVTGVGFWDFVISVDPNTSRSYLGSIAEVSTGVFGIIITVVAIIVQLSANRYTSKIVELFIKDRINVAMLGLFAVICVSGIWVMNSVQKDFLPRIGILTYLGLTSVGFLAIVPYFYYVFEYLKPRNIIDTIEQQSNALLLKVQKDNMKIEHLKDTFVDNIERLSEIALNSLVSLDRSLGLNCIQAMQNIAVHYLSEKEKCPSQWLDIPECHFLGCNSEVLEEINLNRYWVEMIILSHLESVLRSSLKKEQELVNAVSIVARILAAQAFYLREKQVLELTMSYFNTFLRSGIEDANISSTSNILHQYRLLAEEIIAAHTMAEEDSKLVIKISEHFKYYGQFAASKNIPDILETTAYDLRILIEKAFVENFKFHDELLDIFLTVDDFPESEEQEKTLRGVRKSQAILASFYVQFERKELAQVIFDDMKLEPKERIRSIMHEILNLETEKFWEITDRWVCFDYINQKRKEALVDFFRWFEN